MSELRKDSLSFIETLGQSVANVSPTLTPALAVAVVAGMAGTASWLVYVAATIALLIVGLNVSKLANRIPAAGSFFIYVSRALGPSYGLLAGWSLLAAYLFTAMALTVATSIFIKTLITTLQVSVTPPTIAIYLIVSALVLWFAFRDIRLSSRVGLTLEAISVVIILAVSIAALAHFDFKADAKQFTLEGADVGKSLQAIVFAIFSFVGFESAASLGKEARNPERVIPKAIIWTAISAGVFFVFTTYVITQGFADDATKLGASGAPLGDILAGQNPLIIALVYFGAAISSFACALASINAFGRTLFSLGRYQILHSSVGLVHAKFKTPHIAVTVGAIINFAAVALLSGNSEVDTFGWYGTIASFGFIVVYFLVSVAAPAYLKKTGELTTGAATIGALGEALMVLALAGSLYPVPAFPYNLLPYGFLAYLLLGIVWFYVLKARAPEALLGIENDMEAAAAQAVASAEPAPAE